VTAIGLPDCPNNTNGASTRAAPIMRCFFKVISLSRRVVTGPPEGVQLRQPTWLHKFDANLSVLSISRLIGRAVAQNILIPKFDSNFGRNVRQVRQVIDHEVPSPRWFGDIGEESRSGQLFRSPAARRHRFVDTDRINLDVRFLHKVFDFAFRVAAAVIAAIGDDDQRLARVMRFFHCVEGEIDPVEQSSSSLGLRERESVLDLLETMRDGIYQFGPVVELNEESFIFRVGGFEEFGYGLAGFLQLGAHAPAGIEDDADR
jgi:hypothetical protein